MLDIHKTNPTPVDKWEAVEFMNKAQQDLLEALHIMESMIENDSDEYKEIHVKRMKNFIKKFEG